jgi:hypothetical protein
MCPWSRTMRTATIVLLWVMAGANVASAQEYRVEHSLGYSYINIDTNNLTSRQNANGWEATDSINLSKWLAIEDIFSAYYKTYQVPFDALAPLSPYGGTQPAAIPVHVTDYSYAAGPRVNIRPFFVHALVGGDYLTGSAFFIPPITRSQGGLVGIFGGGVELPFSPHFAFRTTADYAFSSHNIFGGSAYIQNNFRVGAALVFRWWKVSPRGSVVASQPTTHGMLIPALGITTAKPREGEGAEITSIMPDSPAAQTQLHVGDVINSVDGKPIKSPMDLAVALSDAGNKAKLGVLINGQWQSETALILGR